MPDPVTSGSSIQAAKVAMGASGVFVWGLSLNELAAIVSIAFTLVLILERLGVVLVVKACFARLAKYIRGNSEVGR